MNLSINSDDFRKKWLRYKKCHNALSFTSYCWVVCTPSSLHTLKGPFQSPEIHQLSGGFFIRGFLIIFRIAYWVICLLFFTRGYESSLKFQGCFLFLLILHIESSLKTTVHTWNIPISCSPLCPTPPLYLTPTTHPVGSAHTFNTASISERL